MKKFHCFLIALLISSCAMAQNAQPCATCLPDGITFNSQAQIDTFQTAYPGCTEIQGNVNISGANIIDLYGLNVLNSISGDLTISNNDVLTSLAGLENLSSITGSLYIFFNASLTSLTGLEELNYIGGSLGVSCNNTLTSLSGLDDLAAIGGNLQIGEIWYGGNPVLTSISGLENLLSIGGDLRFWNDDALTSLNGLEGLTSIGSCLYVEQNDELTNLTGLDHVTSIGGNLNIMSNNSLSSLAGLENLTSITGWLSIQYNEVLSCLTCLDNIEPNTISALHILNNPALSTCAVHSICDYLADPNGTVEIVGNAVGCNCQEEVEAACAVGLDESAVGGQRSAVRIYPNPANGVIILEIPAKNSKFQIPGSKFQISIFDVNGRVILQRQVTDPLTALDVSGLDTGIYLVRVVSDKVVMVGKFVKH